MERVPIISGALFSIAAVCAAVGNHLCGGLLKRASPRAVIAGSASAGAAGTLLYALSGNTGLLFFGSAIFGVAIGVATTAAYTAATGVVPSAHAAPASGCLTTASLIGLAISPIVSGLLGAVSIRAVFLLDTICAGHPRRPGAPADGDVASHDDGTADCGGGVMETPIRCAGVIRARPT